MVAPQMTADCRKKRSIYPQITQITQIPTARLAEGEAGSLCHRPPFLPFQKSV
jgi:hypothetical protein